jgi:DNA-nicking Smr family endonuclease
MQVTKEGLQKIKAWKRAKEKVRSLDQRLDTARTELANAENELADFLLPSDAKASELFCVWVGDSIVAARHENGVKTVMVRTVGKHWNEI